MLGHKYLQKKYLANVDNGEPTENKGHIRKLTFDSTDKKQIPDNASTAEPNIEAKNKGQLVAYPAKILFGNFFFIFG